ncbi:MAG: hypothetical protein KAR42_15980 [candidate division Zixibacteria bacterium]|nr:hypothetical protein [candidate division Zixibacteria bacterium]
MAIKTICPTCGEYVYSKYCRLLDVIQCKKCKTHFEIPLDADEINDEDIPEDYIKRTTPKPLFVPSESGIQPKFNLYKHDKTIHVLLGVILFAGGVLGLLSIVNALLAYQLSPGFLFILCLFFVLYTGSVASGIGMIRRKQLARFWAAFVFFMQIPIFGSNAFSYNFISGPAIIGFISAKPSMSIQFYFGGQFSLSIMNELQPFMIGINFFALAVFLYLVCRKRFLPESSGAQHETQLETKGDEPNITL